MSARPGNGRLRPLTVVKVGGSLLQGSPGLQRVVEAVADRQGDGGDRLLVVASALTGVTNQLERAAIQALEPGPRNGHLGKTMEELRQRHLEAARTLSDGGPELARIRKTLDETAAIVASIRDRGELPGETYARLLSAGERLSVILLAAALQQAGQGASPLTAEEVGLRARGPRRAGSCDLEASRPAFRELQGALAHQIPVLTGFYGIDRRGGCVLFGRGGSDDTACAVAAGLEARHLELWKDVPGIMSADPQQVRGARVIPEISFDEVTQLGAYGSGALHRGCLEPLRGRSTRTLICALPGSGSEAGTLLLESLERGGASVVALMGRRALSTFQLHGGPGKGLQELAGRALNGLIDAGIPLAAFATARSTVRVRVAAADSERTRLLLAELARGCRVGLRRSPALVGAVGEGVAADPGIRSRMLSCLAAAGVRSDPVPRPAGGSGLSCSVHPEDLGGALSSLHEHFFSPGGNRR